MPNGIDGYIFISTHLDTDPAQREGEELGDELDEHLRRALEQIRREMDGVGDSSLTAGGMIKANLISDFIISGVKRLGSALAGAAKESLALAQNSETAFAKVTTLLKGNDLQQYYDGLMEISNRKGVAFADLAESAYSALSAGVSQDNVLKFVENSVGLAKGGFTETATAIDIVTTALNAYHMEMSEATHVQDVLITTQNLGKTTVGELASNMGKLIPTANGVNIAFDQLGAMYATVTANGVATAESTTYLNSMINELGAAGTTAEKAMMEATKGTDMAGKKFAEMQAEGYDVTDVLALMDDYAKSTGKSLADMFSSSEGAKAAAILLDNSEKFKENLDAMANSAGAAQTAAATMADTTAEKINIAKTQIDNLVTTFGNALIPEIGEIAESVSGVVSEADIDGISNKISGFVNGTLAFLRDNIKAIGSAISGAVAGVVAFNAASVVTKAISSWQQMVAVVNTFTGAEGAAAIAAAAHNNTLSVQQIRMALLSGKIDIATAKQLGLNGAMAASPAGIIAVAVGALAAAITGFNESLDDCNEKTQDLMGNVETLKEKSEEYHNKAVEMGDIADEYKKISESSEDVEDKTEKLKELQDRLTEGFGGEAEGIDLVTAAFSGQSEVLDELLAKRQEYENMSRDWAQQALDELERAEKEGTAITFGNAFSGDEWVKQWAQENLSTFDWGRSFGADMAGMGITSLAGGLGGVIRAFTGDTLYLNGTFEERLEDLNKLEEYLLRNGKGATDLYAQVKTMREQMEQDAEDKKQYQDVLSKYTEGDFDNEDVEKAVEAGFEKGVKNSKIANSKIEQNMFNRDGNAWRVNSEAQSLKGRTDLYDEWYDYLNRRRGVSKAKGGITDNEYFDRLVEITDLYLVEGTDEWWKSQQEISRLEQSLAASQKTSEKISSKTVDEAAERLKKYRDEKQLTDDKYNAGELDASAYLGRLKALRNAYLEEGTHEWYAACEGISDFISEQEKKRYDERVDAFEKERSELQYQLKTNQISEKKYYEELAKIRDKYLDENSDEWRDAFLESYEFNQKILEQNKKTLQQMFDDIKDETFSALSGVVSARDSLAAKLMDFNKTFEKVAETIPETVAVKGDFTITTAEHDEKVYKMDADSVEDNIRILEEYGAMLDALKARGADDTTMGEILDLDVEKGMEFGKKLLAMSDTDWQDYFGSLERLRQTAMGISEKYYQNEVESLKTNFLDRLRSEFEGLDDDMLSIGADAALSFVTGWNEELGKQDLTVNDVLLAMTGGTLEQAPPAARIGGNSGAFNSQSGISGSSLENHGSVTIPILLGVEKLAEVVIEGINATNLRVGKNVLNN